MKHVSRWLVAVIIALAFAAQPASASTRYVVRNVLGLNGVKLNCLLLGCSIGGGMGDPNGQLFVLTTRDGVDPITFLIRLLSSVGVLNAEIDQFGKLNGATASQVPAA